MMQDQDTLDRHINSFARRSFRDTADGDYISARLACRALLTSQFLWAAQQTLEKYLKYILLVNRIPAKKVGHNILSALDLTQRLPFKIELRPESLKFIKHVARYGEYRYLDISYFVRGYVLLDLDRAVWDLRRYCQVLDVCGKELPTDEQLMLEKAKENLLASGDRPPHEFRLIGGFLEQILDKKDHPAREALVWQNAFFGARSRTYVRVQNHMSAQNSPLYIYPHMLDELLKYVKIPEKLAGGYRQHLENRLAEQKERNESRHASEE